jgi:hypothetical protein
MKTPEAKITLIRIDGASRRTVEYSVANFIETCSDENSPNSREQLASSLHDFRRKLARRQLLADQGRRGEASASA